jgi:predicted Zn-dependent peptidase
MNSKFDEEEITKEKGVVVEEIKMYEDNPNRAINELLYSHLWKDQPLGRNIAGSIPSVKDLSSVDIRNFINKYYYASNAMFVVSGDLSGVNVKELVESNFKLPMRTDLAVFDKARINEERTLIVNRPVEQSHICLATYGLESNNPLNYNLRIANSVLGLGAGSYLYQEIREKLGAAYYVYSWTDNYSDTGIFCMQAGLDNSKVSEGMDSMISSFNAIKNQKVLTEDLKRAKEIYKGYLSMELESSEDMGRWIAHQYIENGEFNTLDEVKKIVQAITAEDIERVMSETIFKDLHLVMLTSLEDNDKLISTIYQ